VITYNKSQQNTFVLALHYAKRIGDEELVRYMSGNSI